MAIKSMMMMLCCVRQCDEAQVWPGSTYLWLPNIALHVQPLCQCCRRTQYAIAEEQCIAEACFAHEKKSFNCVTYCYFFVPSLKGQPAAVETEQDCKYVLAHGASMQAQKLTFTSNTGRLSCSVAAWGRLIASLSKLACQLLHTLCSQQALNADPISSCILSLMHQLPLQTVEYRQVNSIDHLDCASYGPLEFIHFKVATTAECNRSWWLEGQWI